MTVREYLGRGFGLEKELRMLREEIMRLREMSVSISSPASGTGNGHDPNRRTDAPFEKTILKIRDLEEKAAARMEELLSFREELVAFIDTLEDRDEKLILFYRYACGRTWVEIGERIGRDERTVRRRHGKAVSALEERNLPEKN